MLHSLKLITSVNTPNKKEGTGIFSSKTIKMIVSNEKVKTL
jgi:hypothetical protein